MLRKELATEKGTIVYYASERVDQTLPWLVFLPGLTADHRLFEKQIQFFCDKANCLTWDPPAHGESRPFELDFTMDDMAVWVHEILEAEGADHPILVGQSMGGYVSQAFMDLFPGETGGFISIDSAPLKRHYYPNWEVMALKHTEGMYHAIPWRLLKPWGCMGTAQTSYGRATMRAFMDRYSKREYCALAGFGFRLLAQAIEAERPYEIDCPALLLCGRKDHAGDVRAFNRAWTKKDGIELRWIEGAGHNANTDAPDEINDIIWRFAEYTSR